jgi:predicted Zn-dependent peptidase
MEPVIRPEPTDEERRAILEELGADEPREPGVYGSRWREAALEEGLQGEASAEPGGFELPD